VCLCEGVCVSIHRIFLHGNPKGIAEPMHQDSCGATPCFKYSALLEIPRISRILSLSFLTVLCSELYRTLYSWRVYSQKCSGGLKPRPFL